MNDIDLEGTTFRAEETVAVAREEWEDIRGYYPRFTGPGFP